MNKSFSKFILTKYNLDNYIEDFLKRLMNDELTLEEKQKLVNYLRYTLNQTKRFLEGIKNERN